MPTSYPANQGPNDSSASSPNASPDAKILARMHKRWKHHQSRWKEIWDRGDLDMQALDPIQGPWTDAEIKVRDDAKRPWVHLDQLNQYSNMLINEVRQNPIAIKVDAGDSVDPNDPAANEQAKAAARLTENRIRHIEYEQNAAQAIITAFESAVQRGYGAFGLLTEDVAWDDFNQKVKVRRFADSNSVSWDPDCKEADCCDMQDAFVWKRILIDDFQRDYKDSAPCSFGPEDQSLAGDWLDLAGDSMQIAEYWEVVKTKRTLYLLKDGSPQGLKVFKDELPEGAKVQKRQTVYPDGRVLEILKEKQAEERHIMQYLTNGLEILDRFEWAGSWIPIFPIVGKEKYTRRNGKTERTLESYIRGGIKGQKLFNLYKTNEAEDVSKIPQNLLIMYEGQEATSTPWEFINKMVLPYVLVKERTENTPQDVVLPPPQIQQYQLRISELAVGEEGARRSIQAALGSYGFTKNDDTNVKSGKAINLLDRQSDMGSFHFIDNAKCTVKHYGRCLEELTNAIEDTARNVGTREADGTHKVVRMNEKIVKDGKTTINKYRASEDAANLVTIGAGNSYQSQREEWTSFAADLGKDPNIMAKAGDLIVKSQNGGPIADQIAERLTPPEFRSKDGQPPIPPEVQQQMQQKDMELQALNAHAKQVEQQLIELQDKAKAEQIKQDSAMALAKENNATKIEIAEIAASVKEDINTLNLQLEAIKHIADVLTGQATLAQQANESDLQRQHEQQLASQQALQAQQQQSAAQDHEQQLAAQQQASADQQQQTP